MRKERKYLGELILEHAKQHSGVPIAAKGLLHLGSLAAVDQALSRLTERGQLVRVGWGVYLCSLKSRFGTRAPSVEEAVAAIARQKGEVIVVGGAAAANELGLTTQVPVRPIYWTSGRTRRVNLGKQVVELRHVPGWQLALAQEPAGQIIRALARLGPEKAEPALQALKSKLPVATFRELASLATRMPSWMAQVVSAIAHGLQARG